MYNFDPYDVLLSIAINIPGFVLQGHVFKTHISLTLIRWASADVVLYI